MITDLSLNIGTQAAFYAAKQSFDVGGVPVGSALVVDDRVVSTGHNKRVQKGSNVLHGETDCIENAGHAFDFARAAIFTTLSPCLMCAGAILLFKIPVLVILDTENVGDFTTGVPLLKDSGVNVVVYPHQPSIELNRRFQSDPATRRIWLGDVGIS